MFPIPVSVAPGWEIKKWDYPEYLLGAHSLQLPPPVGIAAPGSHPAHLRSHMGSDPCGPSWVWSEEGLSSALLQLLSRQNCQVKLAACVLLLGWLHDTGMFASALYSNTPSSFWKSS